MRIRRGDVYWLDLPEGRRPGAVLTRDAAIGLLDRLIVVPATRTARGAPSEVRLVVADGMPQECVLSLDNLRLVPKHHLKRRITTLSAARLDEICEKLAFSLGCR